MYKLRIWLATTTIAAATVLVVSTGPSMALQPPDEHKEWCFDNKEYSCDGLLCSCCSADGCWICARDDWDDCHWDDALGASVGPKAPLERAPIARPGGSSIVPGGGVLDPGPRSPRKSDTPNFRPGRLIKQY